MVDAVSVKADVELAAQVIDQNA